MDFTKEENGYICLLVDDERLELNTLKNYVNWEKLGIRTVYTANNGLQALGVALEKHPDIVFTDIRMPVMDGIEFASKLREEDKRVKIIFLTGYDEMDFIRSAFRLSATDYILKPFLVEEIEQLVENILPALHQEQNADHSRVHAEEKLIDHIFKDDSRPQEELIRQFADMEGVEEGGFVFGVVGLYGKWGNPPGTAFFQAFPEVFYYIELHGLSLLLFRTCVDGRDVAENMAVWLDKNRIPLSVVYLNGWRRLPEARTIRRRFEAARDAAFYLDGGSAAALESLEKENRQKELGEAEQHRLHALRRDIVEQISHGDGARCHELLKEYLEICGRARSRVCRNSLLRLYHYINDELVLENEELTGWLAARRPEEGSFPGIAEEGNRAGQLVEGLSRYLDRLLEWYSSMQENANYRVALFVENYIRKHYMEPVSVESMADQIGLSPNYVRSIFKNSRGTTINNYLTEYRLETACRLLKNSPAKVSTVARMVGYDSVSYFCATFQKRYGKTPNEWRRGL